VDPSYEQIRVVLVDDDDVFTSSLSSVLAEDGRVAVLGTACNGLEGLRLVEELRPDVAVLDLVMPVMDGATAAEEIAARHPGTKVVFVSGSIFEDGAGRPLDGAVPCVTKARALLELAETLASLHTAEAALPALATSG
jgi:DNA-binding NarL/FixJ family response regulator